MPRRTHRGKTAQAPSILLPLPLLSFAMLLTGIESAATHVSDQVQPASSVSKLQAPGKPTESTFIAGDPVTECVIHYSLICTPYPHPLTHPTTSPIEPQGNSAAWSNPSLSILVVLPLLAFLFTRCSSCVSGLFADQRSAFYFNVLMLTSTALQKVFQGQKLTANVMVISSTIIK